MSAVEMRRRLSQVMRDEWSTDTGAALKNTLASQAVSSGFAKCLADLMAKGAGGKTSFEACAKKANLRTSYKSAWGKPTG